MEKEKRARFNLVLDADLGALIFNFLPNIDRVMARSTCREWRRLIPPQRIGFHKDFLGTLADYDGSDYVSQVEAHTTIPPDVCLRWYHKIPLPLMKKGAPYTMMYYCRHTKAHAARAFYFCVSIV